MPENQEITHKLLTLTHLTQLSDSDRPLIGYKEGNFYTMEFSRGVAELLPEIIKHLHSGDVIEGRIPDLAALKKIEEGTSVRVGSNAQVIINDLGNMQLEFRPLKADAVTLKGLDVAIGSAFKDIEQRQQAKREANAAERTGPLAKIVDGGRRTPGSRTSATDGVPARS